MANVVLHFVLNSNKSTLLKCVQRCVNSRRTAMKWWQVNTLRLMYWRSKNLLAVPHPLRHRNEWQDWNYKSELFAFNQRLSEKFSEDQLRIAFTDISYIEEEQKKRDALQLMDVQLNLVDNSELSRLGEQKMKPFIKAYLRRYVPRIPEEGICSVTEYLMSDDVLADIASKIGCTDLIMCNTIPPSKEMFSKTTKALIGALLKDTDDKHTERFIGDFVLTYLHEKDLMEIWDIPQPEITLTNILRNDGMVDPEPRLLRETGRNTILCCYMVGLYVNKNLIGSGAGESVKIAREMAAYDALRRMFHLTPAKTSFKYGKFIGDVDFAPYYKEHVSLRDWKLSAFEEKHRLIASA